MATTTKTIIHDEHTQGTITLKNTILPLNKGELIMVRKGNKQVITGTVIKRCSNIVICEDEIGYFHEVHIHVY